MTRSVLVTGASGFLGKTVVQRLAVNDGRPTIAVVRSAGARFPAPVRVDVLGELWGGVDWATSLSGIEAVIHCAARAHVMKERSSNPLSEYRRVNVEGTLALARQAAAAGVRRFVFISSIKVNGERTAPGMAFHPDDTPAPEDAYGLSKWEAEKGLLALAKETGMEVVIIRPPLVYGPGVKGNFAVMMRWVRKGVPLPLGSVANQRSMVALDNLVDFIILCADPVKSPLAANQIFLVADHEPVSTTVLLQKIAKAYRLKPRLIPFPSAWLSFLSKLVGKASVADRVLGSQVVDGSKTQTLLGWTPVISMDEQLQKMVEHDSRL